MGQSEEVKECGLCRHYDAYEGLPFADSRNTGYCIKHESKCSIVLSKKDVDCEYWESKLEEMLMNKSW